MLFGKLARFAGGAPRHLQDALPYERFDRIARRCPRADLLLYSVSTVAATFAVASFTPPPLRHLNFLSPRAASSHLSLSFPIRSVALSRYAARPKLALHVMPLTRRDARGAESRSGGSVIVLRRAPDSVVRFQRK